MPSQWHCILTAECPIHSEAVIQIVRYSITARHLMASPDELPSRKNLAPTRRQPGGYLRRQKCKSPAWGARLPGVPDSSMRCSRVPSPPRTPRRYRAFEGNSSALSGKLIELDRLSLINRVVFSITHPASHTRVDPTILYHRDSNSVT